MSRTHAQQGAALATDAPAGPGDASRLPAQGAHATGDSILHALWTAWFSLDPRAAAAEAVAAAEGSVRSGSSDEDAWYALLRGREMLGELGPVAAGVLQCGSLKEAAELLCGRFDRSPRLAAVRARLDGGLPAARAALSVNPAYAPAQVALGRALLRAGRPQAARALLEEVREPERVQGGAVALARARLESGDPGKALIAAARETNAPGLVGLEPAIHDPLVVREIEEVRGLARLELGAVDAGARSLLRAASSGSESARRALGERAERDDFRRALGRLARDGGLPPDARALAAALAA